MFFCKQYNRIPPVGVPPYAIHPILFLFTMRKALASIVATVAVATTILGASSAFAATNATISVTAPTSIELGKPQDIIIKLNPGDGNKVDSILLAGTYSPDVADISFAVASGSVASSFSLTKPVLDTKTGLFSTNLSSLLDTISTATDIVKVTVTPKKAGNFSFALTQGGEQGTQVILTNGDTNILDKSNGITPASSTIIVLGDNSTVSTATPVTTPVATVKPATSTGTVSSTGTTASGTVDSSTSKTVPKTGPGQAFAGIALAIGLGALWLSRRQQVRG